jgi:hypothetical protein
VTEALRGLNTHADFFRAVAEDTAARIAALRASTAATHAASEAAAVRDATATAWLYGPQSHRAGAAGAAAAPGAAGGTAAATAAARPKSDSRRGSLTLTTAGGAAPGSTAGGPDGAAAAAAAVGAPGKQALVSAFHFMLDPLPTVMTPLASPLVVRCGRLMRQVRGQRRAP